MNEDLIMVIVDIREEFDFNLAKKCLRYYYHWINEPDVIDNAFEWEMTDGWEEINESTNRKAV